MTTTGAESFTAFHSPDESAAPASYPARSSSQHSSVAYLFGGLASMVGLIGLAILILACSYWKLSGRFEEEEEDGDGDGGQLDRVELGLGGEKKNDDGLFENKILVIMAGDNKPTFIATPSTSRASSFGSHGGGSSTAEDTPPPPGDEDKSRDDLVCLETVGGDHRNP
ncbi:protein GLUTAMINE DUMPER 2 [Impatiens glandulifera]|uniref:protein GLUTAMINE DUMPER 2 n=1 Tax=Impatiens glandulifera TaxID=253017 RepID=UPI001FB063DA|nr:protein GLUTAMINE DUMPER 2 [Impatiens glandulifera]